MDVSCRKKIYGRAAKFNLENEVGVATYVFLPSKSNHAYDSSDQLSSPLLLLVLYFHPNDVGFAYAYANADADDACSDADASA